MKKIAFFLFATLFLVTAQNLNAQCSGVTSKSLAVNVSQPTPGGDVVDVAMSSKQHTTLVAAVKAAGLVETLKGDGPFTVFAPVNTAFAKLPAGTVEKLLQPANKSTLVDILTYHVVAGNFDAAKVVAAIRKGNGVAKLTTVQGGVLVATLVGDSVILEDANGNRSAVTATDLKADNGVIHVIDTVVLP